MLLKGIGHLGFRNHTNLPFPRYLSVAPESSGCRRLAGNLCFFVASD
jgi:hypothetical protein